MRSYEAGIIKLRVGVGKRDKKMTNNQNPIIQYLECHPELDSGSQDSESRIRGLRMTGG
jgi:hypothetical protein